MAIGDADEDAAVAALIAKNQPTSAPTSSPAGKKTAAEIKEDADIAALVANNQPPPSVAGAAAPPALSTPVGVVRNTAAGVLDGAGNLINTAVNPAGNLIGKPLATGLVFAHDALAPYLGYQRFPDDVRNLLLGDQVQQPGSAIIDATGKAIGGASPDDVPVNGTQERLARKVTGNAMTMALMGGATPGPLIASGVGAVAGDQAAQYAPDWAKPMAELGGNIAGTGGTMGVSGATGNALINRIGAGISDPVMELAKTARDKFGIQITAPQMSENSLVRIANDQSKRFPLSGSAAQDAAQRDAWMSAVGKQFDAKDLSGKPATLLTGQVMENAARAIGDKMDRGVARTTMDFGHGGTGLSQDLIDIINDSHSMPLGPGGEKSIQNLIDHVYDASDGKSTSGSSTMSGKAYSQLTATGTPLERATHAGDPNVRYLATSVRDALDNAFQQAAPPEDQALLSQGRAQYRALKTVEPLVASSTDGTISPAQLLSRVNTTSRRFDGSTSGTAFKTDDSMRELGQIGQQFLKPVPNSATADRSLVNLLMTGGAGYGLYTNPKVAAIAATGAALPIIAGRVARSTGLSNRLIDATRP